MKTRSIIIVTALLMFLTSALFLTGCNTWDGLGKDIETTGESMQ
jgi:predicted small secreted protein